MLARPLLWAVPAVIGACALVEGLLLLTTTSSDFCSDAMPMDMQMAGFATIWGTPSCVVLFNSSWILATRWDFLLAFVLVMAGGAGSEALGYVRRRRRAAVVAAKGRLSLSLRHYWPSAALGYLLMLIASLLFMPERPRAAPPRRLVRPLPRPLRRAMTPPDVDRPARRLESRRLWLALGAGHLKSRHAKDFDDDVALKFALRQAAARLLDKAFGSDCWTKARTENWSLWIACATYTKGFASWTRRGGRCRRCVTCALPVRCCRCTPRSRSGPRQRGAAVITSGADVANRHVPEDFGLRAVRRPLVCEASRECGCC